MSSSGVALVSPVHVHTSIAHNWTSGLRWSQIQDIKETAEAQGVSCEEALGDWDGDVELDDIEEEDCLPRPGFVPAGVETDRDAILSRKEGYAFLLEEVSVVYAAEEWPGGQILARQGRLFLLGVGYPETAEDGSEFWTTDQRKWVWLAA